VFNDCAEEALNYYVSVFNGAKILSIQRSDTDGPIAKGKVLHAELELDGRVYTAFDGGPHFSFSEAFSLVATCDTQEQLDEVWTKLSAGGQEQACGWLKDRFGLSWQVIPASLGQMMTMLSPAIRRRSCRPCSRWAR
jgi:predicted 3-demethylubiquinone-9 3-methyltransferase (glyoxalase superfamily)